MIGDRCSYNYGMNNDETYTPCTKCGRPMAYCKGQCCGKPKGCQCKEYGPAVCGAIRQCEPKCPYTAVIPSIVVEHADSLKDLCDTFVHVSDINTTFYIDDKHRTIITWAGPVEYDNYDLATNSLGLRSQFLIDFANERGAYYDKTGNYKTFDFGQINDATLTVKQGGTTLGTFSANASEDVEINIPENSNEPVRLRMEWTTSDGYWGDVAKVDRNMRGTVLDYYFVGGVLQGVCNVATYDETNDVYFVNEETLEELDLEDVYAMLESGTQIILDNVPIGSYVQYNANGVSISSHAPAGTDNVALSGLSKSVEHIEDVTTTTSAYSGMVLSVAAESVAAVPLGIMIGKEEKTEGGETTSEIFCWVQGVSWQQVSA